jgi:hypothetical protein
MKKNITYLLGGLMSLASICYAASSAEAGTVERVQLAAKYYYSNINTRQLDVPALVVKIELWFDKNSGACAIYVANTKIACSLIPDPNAEYLLYAKANLAELTNAYKLNSEPNPSKERVIYLLNNIGIKDAYLPTKYRLERNYSNPQFVGESINETFQRD